jgi:peptide/nickel transport system permease protein
VAVAEPIVTAPAVTRRRRSLTWHPSRRWSIAGASLFGVLTLIALAAPLLSPHDPLTPVGIPLAKPGQAGFLLGSDSIGRDVLSRTLYGVRASWFAAIVVFASGLLIGGLIGVVAGSSGGRVDNLLMRITDIFLALPAPVLAIAVVAALGPSFSHTLVAVAIVWWPFYARIVRGEISKFAARPHVEAARLAGAGRFRIAFRHLLPGALPAAAVTASLDVGNLVLALAGLSFLGLGQSAPAPELGADSARNLSLLLQQWWVPVIPGLAVAVIAVIANIAGDSVRNLIEPE